LFRETNEDGRLSHIISTAEFQVGVYKLKFDTKEYYDTLGTKTFYPYVEIVFEIEKPEEHYHVPLLLSPYGFSTYRGS
jgi:5-hydroxyisourate hydrolase